MRILKFKKIGIDKYKVIFENNELILYEDIILKYNLISKNEINIDELENILEDNKCAEMYSMSLKYISTRLRSKKEIENYLLKKGYDINNIYKVISKLEDSGVLDEKKYIEAYINDSINLKNIGPYKIKEELIKLGFDENQVDINLSNIEENVWINKINNYISKLINGSKTHSSNMLRQKILNDLYIKGYDKELIYPLLEKIVVIDNNNIKLEYEKAYKKYSSKYKNNELNKKIILYLQRKGYNYSEIKEYLYIE